MFLGLSVKMSKLKPKLAAESGEGCGPRAGEKSAEKKRSFFFKRTEKKQKKKKTLPLPPKDAQEFSANWKTLLSVLGSKQTPGPEQSDKRGEEKSKDPKPQSSTNKSIPKTGQKQDLDKNKPGPGPQRKSSKASDGGKTERADKKGAQNNGKLSSADKLHQAQKRKTEDSGDRTQKSINKKKKVEEEEKQTPEPDIWFDDVDPDDIEATLGSEAADIMRKKNGLMKSSVESTEKALVKERAFDGLTRAVAMDCEMVGVGPEKEESMLARVSIVNQFGKCVYDKYVKPTETVTDYRTAVSGIRPADIEKGEDIRTVQKEVAAILKGRILVGHAIHNDLKILLLDHPKKNIRDTQKYKPFKAIAKSSRPALRVLCREVLNVKVQQGEHSSVQDAQATMRLYTLVKSRWEAEIKATRGQSNTKKSSHKPEPTAD
ncbi:RNA exonuclease 4 [Hoplias malabaricus]|uniref:RNA exonuclease 4 n=1 Tax=Hoplias malabaricus TaxID=27720 RepID=UPI0034628AA7